MQSAKSETTPWRARPYGLAIFGPDDRLVIVIDLTPEEAELIGVAWCPDDTDGVGEYPLGHPGAHVFLSPQNGE